MKLKSISSRVLRFLGPSLLYWQSFL